jgi:hypothetical protein
VLCRRPDPVIPRNGAAPSPDGAGNAFADFSSMGGPHRSKDGGPEIQRSRVALLLIDVINPMDFEGGEALVEAATRAASSIRRLQHRARALRIPVIYVNDNYDCWHLGFRELIEKFRTADVPGSRLIELFEPDHGLAYYILKKVGHSKSRSGPRPFHQPPSLRNESARARSPGKSSRAGTRLGHRLRRTVPICFMPRFPASSAP